MAINVTRNSKVMLHHLSAVDESMLEEFIDLGLDFIWKTMHCSGIKINLHHYMQEDVKNPGTQKLMGNATLKSILKTRTFRWKTLRNEQNGYRIETWEGANGTFKEQLKPDTAFIYRRGLAKGDLLKDTINISVLNKVVVGAAKLTQTSKPRATRYPVPVH